MKKYKIKNPYVEAVKYRKGMEDYFVCMRRAFGGAVCDEYEYAGCDKDYKTCPHRLAMLETETGDKSVDSTDYIVKVNGETKVMNEDDFNKQYELVEE